MQDTDYKSLLVCNGCRNYISGCMAYGTLLSPKQIASSETTCQSICGELPLEITKFLKQLEDEYTE